MSRRSIIILVLALAVGGPLVLGGIAILAGGGDDRRVGAIKTSYAVSKFALMTDGASPTKLGFLKSYDGCRLTGNVAQAAPNTAGVVRRTSRASGKSRACSASTSRWNPRSGRSSRT